MHRLIAHLLPALPPRLAFGRFAPMLAAGAAAVPPAVACDVSAALLAVAPGSSAPPSAAAPSAGAADLPTATADAPTAAEAAPPPADELPQGCGWYQSSHDLRQGMAVQEWPAAGAMAGLAELAELADIAGLGADALWAAAGRWPTSARLQ
jgi:hypothetical protein